MVVPSLTRNPIRLPASSDEDAGDDGQLLQRAQASAHRGGGDLGDVGGRDHRGRSDTQPADDTPEDHVPGAESQPRPDGGGREQHRGDNHHLDPAQGVRETPSQVGASHAPQQRRRHGESLEHRAEPEIVGHGVHGTVDDSGIKTEEETAESGDSCE